MKRLLIFPVLMGIGIFFVIDVARAQIEVQPLPVRAWPPREGDYIQTSIHPIDAADKPAKLAYLTGKNAYISIYKFEVEPGERYTIRAEYMGDGKDGTLLLTGDNPLTDYAYTYGPEDVRRSFSIHRGFPGGEISHCKFAQVVNFTVSPTSEHSTLWLVAHSNKPATGFGFWLWRPAISDHAALNETYAPCPGENRRETVGRIEKAPLWLNYDPSEKKRTNADPSPPSDLAEDDFDFGEKSGEGTDAVEKTDFDFGDDSDDEGREERPALRKDIDLGTEMVNLALEKPTLQSSTCGWSHDDDPAVDSQGAVDGSRNGGYSFHTDLEVNPWWQVDLGSIRDIQEIKIFNRPDCCGDRAKTIRVLLSNDGSRWNEIYAHDDSHFGQLKVNANGRSTRYVRLQLAEEQHFHLVQVEVWGLSGETVSTWESEEEDEEPIGSRRSDSKETVTANRDGCAFSTLSQWTGVTEEKYFPHITDDDNAYSKVSHSTIIPGPGKVKVTLGVSGRHETANTQYGAERFRARVKLFSSESVLGDQWVAGGHYYPGVTDYGEQSHTFDANDSGEVLFRLVPERCKVRTYEDEVRCWVFGSTEEPGVKILPMNYDLLVEYSPCK